MKYCDNCKRVFEGDFKYCPKCGKELVEPVRYDIFGERMDSEKKHEDTIVVDIETTNSKEPKIDLRWYEGNIGEILSWISLGAFLIPFVGTIISGIALIINATKKKKGFIILSVITLVLSILYVILLLKTNTFTKIFELTE